MTWAIEEKNYPHRRAAWSRFRPEFTAPFVPSGYVEFQQAARAGAEN